MMGPDQEQQLIQEVARKMFTHSLLDAVFPLKSPKEIPYDGGYYCGEGKFGFTDMNVGSIIPNGPFEVKVLEHVFGYNGHYGHILAQEVQILNPRHASLSLIARIIEVEEETEDYYAFRRGSGYKTALNTSRVGLPITTMAVSMFSDMHTSDFRNGYRIARPSQLDDAITMPAETVNLYNMLLRNNARDIKQISQFGTRMAHQEGFLSMTMINQGLGL